MRMELFEAAPSATMADEPHRAAAVQQSAVSGTIGTQRYSHLASLVVQRSTSMLSILALVPPNTPQYSIEAQY
jgi:hypothetical protein